MATIIQIKSSSTANAPTAADLLEAEMAYAEDRAGNGAGAVLYISSLNSDNTTEAIHKIGGKYYTDKVDNRLIDATTTVGGKLTLAEGTSNGANKVTLKAADALAGDITFTLPGTTGTSGQVLITDGSGGLSFAAAPATSFTLSDGSATDTFNTGETLTFTGGAGLTSTVSNNTVTFDVAGTADRITANTNSIDIASTYAGQTSIVTLGTVTTGTWNATAVGLAYGGTGKTTAPAAMANLMGYTSTATAAGTTTLTNTSSYYQQFTGTQTQTVVLPVTSTLQTGWTFHIVNNSTGNLTVNSSGGNAVITVIPGTTAMVTCIGTALTTAADWEAGLTDFSTYTGTGNVVMSTSPTLVTPALGVATATSVNKVAITAPATGATLTIADGKTLTASNTLTFTGTDSSSVNFGAGGTVAYTGGKLSQFAATTSAELLGVISDETGTGALVFGTAPTFTTSIDGGATFGAFASSSTLTVGYTGTAASTTNISTGATATATTKVINLGTGGAAGSTTNVNIGSASGGTTTVNNNLTVTGDLVVNGTTTTVNSTTITVDDKNIELGSVASPTNTTADGGGITLKGATDKTLNWVNATAAWTSSEDFNLLTGKVYEINGTTVLSATALGTGVTGSSLTSVGTLTTGTWNATAIGAAYGGTGRTTLTTNGILYGAGTGQVGVTAAGTDGYFLYSNAGTPAWTNVINGGTY